jgi:PAS domain S-box-containing protein
MEDSPAEPACLRLLLIEDNEDDAFLIAARFRQAGYRLASSRVDTRATVERALADDTWDLVISDHALQGFDALAALEMVRAHDADLPFIIASGVIKEELAIAAMRAGAQDYLSKNHLDRLVPAAQRELREAQIKRERRVAQEVEHEREAWLHALAANTPGVMFRAQVDADGGLRFLYAGGATRMLLGLSSEELVADGSRYLQMILPEERAGFQHALQQSVHDLKLNWEGRIASPEGDHKWINLRSSVRSTEAGEPVWEGLMWNITQSKQTEAELRESQHQLAELSNHLQHAKEEERERIAREVHDVLGGDLVALKIEVALLAARLDSNPAQVRSKVGSIGQLLDDAIQTVSRVTRELRPGILKDFGLAAAIECQAQDFSQRTGLPCRILAADHDLELPEDAAVALFRIFQESLTNVCKHAEATEVAVRLVQEGDEVLLEIIDDGKGICAEDLARPRSFGLRGIRERVSSLGGSFHIGPRAPKGTCLGLRVPVSDPLATPCATTSEDLA